MARELLSIADLQAWYGESHILHGVDFSVQEGEVVTLLGRNGAGRTTTLRAIMGLVGARTGSIRIAGAETVHLAPHRIARIGIGYCPEERGIFSTLSVEENLLLPPRLDAGRAMSVGEIYAMFPNLSERTASSGTSLSGGEQQMLAIGRALMSAPRLVLLDEPSLGLSPLLVQTIFGVLRTLHERGATMLLVEQNARAALKIAGRGYVLENGSIAREDTAANLLDDPAVVAAYLGA